MCLLLCISLSGCYSAASWDPPVRPAVLVGGWGRRRWELFQTGKQVIQQKTRQLHIRYEAFRFLISNYHHTHHLLITIIQTCSAENYGYSGLNVWTCRETISHCQIISAVNGLKLVDCQMMPLYLSHLTMDFRVVLAWSKGCKNVSTGQPQFALYIK